jgi:hypothetical protein
MATSLAVKLQIKPGQRLAVLNAPAGRLALLAGELPGIAVTEGVAGRVDSVLLFVHSLGETARLLGSAIEAVPPGRPLWIAYPKGSSGVRTDVNRDRLWEAVQPTGWRPARQVALDEVWSAMRFRPADRVVK